MTFYQKEVESPQHDNTLTDLEQTIFTMEESNLCLHPHHCHSFKPVHFMISFRKCAVCHQMLQAVMFGLGSTPSIVKCVACGTHCHRTCSQSLDRTEKCPVNTSLFPPERSDSKDPDEIHEVNFEQPSTLENNNLPTTETRYTRQDEVDSFTWTQEGPPQHWASRKTMDELITTLNVPCETSDEDHINIGPLHHANHPFASISRALQENISAHFQRKSVPQLEQSSDVPKITPTTLVNVEKSEPNAIVKLATNTFDAVRTGAIIPRRMGVATVAGGIAGGVAGLALAGPVGAYAGYQAGKAVGTLGVILEGSVSIGILVASVATGANTARHIQDQFEERRILTMGEDGISRKVLLVRPNIQIDPVWEQICIEARKNSTVPGFSLLTSASKNRYERDADIVATAEEEIPTNDKVLLLVNRILNDRSSLPGQVYRYLIDRFKDRCRAGTAASDSPRSRRDDAHAVIKYVTATLLDVRPGFGSSSTVTELTATAVENLVFGQIYDLVFDEILSETATQDELLLKNIDNFVAKSSWASDDISEDALTALHMLPKVHSAADKLGYCVDFLQCLSTPHASADSLLKLSCQHIIKARVTKINAEVAFLEEFARDEQLLRGREGYALVTLQASLHFLNSSEDFDHDIFAQDEIEENVPLESSKNSS